MEDGPKEASGSGSRRARSGGRPSKRRFARLAAVQALYQADLNKDSAERVLREFTRHRLGQDIDGLVLDADAEFFAGLVRGVADRLPELDGLITETIASGREAERMEVVLRAILRAGAFELLARADVPARVVIKEYVDIAADFFSAREAALANGILDRLAHQARPAEFDVGTSERADASG